MQIDDAKVGGDMAAVEMLENQTSTLTQQGVF